MQGILTDIDGNTLVSIKHSPESEIKEIYRPFTHCLAVIKADNDFLLGWNEYRKRYEIFGGCIEENETPRECITRECYEELGISDIDFEYIGVMELLLKPDYFSDKERIEYGGLYGITLHNIHLDEIYSQIKDKDEIGKLDLYRNIKGKEPIAEIDEKLLEYFHSKKDVIVERN